MKPDMAVFLKGVLKGAPAVRAGHVVRARVIQAAIHAATGRGDPAQWRVKHLRGFLVAQVASQSAWTCYRYWLTVRLVVVRLRRWEDWAPHLRGTWQKPR